MQIKPVRPSGIKASDLSKSTGVPAATLSSLLNGGQTQKPEHLWALSQHFKVSIEFLLFGEEDRRPTLDDVLTEGIFSGWLKVTIEKAIPDKKKVGLDDK
ncbi:MAG: helix-turn-helix transcriptional regulator [Bdellovibrionaceae bacterium]|nr:helix-turn-helix transcriptional regulator [Pseudobdellovibrionaceae bacterium]